MKTTLKPCPFCGSELVTLEHGAVCAFVRCTSCNAEGPCVYRDEGIKARHKRLTIEKWNSAPRREQ